MKVSLLYLKNSIDILWHITSGTYMVNLEHLDPAFWSRDKGEIVTAEPGVCVYTKSENSLGKPQTDGETCRSSSYLPSACYHGSQVITTEVIRLWKL